MEERLRSVLVGACGGGTRLDLLCAMLDRPRNVPALAAATGVHETTVRYHLDVLESHGLVRPSGDGYGAVYLLTDRATAHWEEIEDLARSVDGEG